MRVKQGSWPTANSIVANTCEHVVELKCKWDHCCWMTSCTFLRDEAKPWASSWAWEDSDLSRCFSTSCDMCSLTMILHTSYGYLGTSQFVPQILVAFSGSCVVGDPSQRLAPVSRKARPHRRLFIWSSAWLRVADFDERW